MTIIKSSITTALMMLLSFSVAEAGRVLHLPSIDSNQLYNFTKYTDGDEVPAPGHPVDTDVSGKIFVDIRLQNISNIPQSGTLHLNDFWTRFQAVISGGVFTVYGPIKIIIKVQGGACAEYNYASTDGSKKNLSIAYTVPPNSRRNISIDIVGMGKYGPPDAALGRSRHFSVLTTVDPKIEVTQDRGALLATYRTSYSVSGHTSTCGGNVFLGQVGFAGRSNGTDLTILLNGGRPF